MAKNKFKQLMLLNQKLYGTGNMAVRLDREKATEEITNNKSKKQKKMQNQIMMAVATGQEVKPTETKKLYIGLAPLKVIAVNPTIDELKLMYGENAKEPQYLKEVDINGTKYKKVRIDVYFKYLYAEQEGIDAIFRTSFFITDKRSENSDHTKVEIIDKYFRANNGEYSSVWATNDDVDNHRIPQYKNGPAPIDIDYRPAYIGEVDFMKFVVRYFNLPAYNVYDKENKTWKTIEHPETAEARFDHIDKWFNGDFSEFKNPMMSVRDSRSVKAFVAIDTYDGKMFNTVIGPWLSSNLASLGSFEAKFFTKALEENRQKSRYSKMEMDTCDLREFKVTGTTFKPANDKPNPFAKAADNKPNPFASKPTEQNQVDNQMPPEGEDDLPF